MWCGVVWGAHGGVVGVGCSVAWRACGGVVGCVVWSDVGRTCGGVLAVQRLNHSVMGVLQTTVWYGTIEEKGSFTLGLKDYLI